MYFAIKTYALEQGLSYHGVHSSSEYCQATCHNEHLPSLALFISLPYLSFHLSLIFLACLPVRYLSLHLIPSLTSLTTQPPPFLPCLTPSPTFPLSPLVSFPSWGQSVITCDITNYSVLTQLPHHQFT